MANIFLGEQPVRNKPTQKDWQNFKQTAKFAPGTNMAQARRKFFAGRPSGALLPSNLLPRDPDMGKPDPTFCGTMKKGGAANHYTNGGKINLDACGVSTGKKSNKCAGW